MRLDLAASEDAGCVWGGGVKVGEVMAAGSFVCWMCCGVIPDYYLQLGGQSCHPPLVA